jgi:hypothetical protein
MEFFIDIFLPEVLWLSGRNINDYLEYFLGGKRQPVRRADNITTLMCNCLEIWQPQTPGTLRACKRPVEGLLYLYLY